MADIEYEFDEELERLLKAEGMENKVQAMIRSVLRKARTRLSSQIHSRISNDPRQAYKAVRNAVYKRIIGGNLNILNRRGSAQMVPYHKRRTLRPGQVGGNRIKPTQRTIDLDSYSGRDRGFILRFLNSGTQERTSRYGARGRITARNFFTSNAQSDMEQAMGELCTLIDEEYNRIFN